MLEAFVSDLVFPESPRWHQGRLWFSDAHDRRVLRAARDGSLEEVLSPEDLRDIPSGLGWLPDGSLLVVLVQSRRVLRREVSGHVSTYADLSSLATGNTNDMVVSADGVAYVGTMGGPDWQRGVPAEIIAVRDGVATVAARDVYFPNGMTLINDESRLVVAESTAARLSSFQIESDGSLTDRRVLAELPGAFPDGICSDAGGCVWAASMSTNEVIKVAQDGTIVDRVSTGEDAAFACALSADSLFVCVGPSGVAPADRAATRPGSILVHHP